MAARSSRETSSPRNQQSGPCWLFRPVTNPRCSCTLTRWGVVVVAALLALAIAMVVDYREYMRVGIDDTSPFDSDVDCGEPTSLIQRDIQLEYLKRTSASLVSPTATGEAPRRLIFASCNNQDKPQEAWIAINDHIAGTHPDSLIVPSSDGSTTSPRGSDAFIWLGDAVYLDKAGKSGFTREPQPLPSMRADYTRQLHRREYCRARRSVPIMGVWDDHDLGENDGNSSYGDKLETKDMFFDFLDFPHANQLGYARQWHNIVSKAHGRANRYRTRWDEAELFTTSKSPVIFSENLRPSTADTSVTDTSAGVTNVTTDDDNVPIGEKLQRLLVQQWAERRARNGTYASHVWGPPGQRVKVILLDVRYNQRKVKRGSPVKDERDETMLGEEQWAWFEREMRDSIAPRGSETYQRGGAEVVFVVSGLEVISWGKLITEGWRAFHRDRVRMMNLVAEIGATSYERAKVTNTRPVAVLLISGDVHFAEMQRTYMPYNGTFTTDGDNNDKLPLPVHEAADYPLWAEYTASGVGATVVETLASAVKGGIGADDHVTPIVSTGAPSPSTSPSSSSLYLMPMTELTTSGVTHGLGEMAGQRTVLGTLAPLVTYPLLRPWVTGWDLKENGSGGALAWQAMGVVESEKAKRQQQGNLWFGHNFATVDVDWENDVIGMKIRNKLGNTVMDYSMPLAFLRAHDIAMLTRDDKNDQSADNLDNIPPGVLRNVHNPAGKAYLAGMLHQTQEEWHSRIQPAEIWDVVEDIRTWTIHVGKYKWLIITCIIATLTAMAVLGNMWLLAAIAAADAVHAVRSVMTMEIAVVTLSGKSRMSRNIGVLSIFPMTWARTRECMVTNVHASNKDDGLDEMVVGNYALGIFW